MNSSNNRGSGAMILSDLELGDMVSCPCDRDAILGNKGAEGDGRIG